MATKRETQTVLDSLANSLQVERSRIDFALGFVVLMLLWEIVGSVTSFFIPTFSDTVASLVYLTTTGQIFGPLAESLRKMFIGFGLGFVVALPVGLMMGASRRIKYLLDSYVNIMFVTSVASMLPLLILFFGTETAFYIAVVFLFCVFHMILNIQAGVENVERELIEAAQVFGANRRQVYRHVYLWAALPFIIAAARIGISRSFRGVIVAELWISAGIGLLLNSFQQALRPSYALATVVALVIVSIIMVRGLYFVETRIAPWRAEIEE